MQHELQVGQNLKEKRKISCLALSAQCFFSSRKFVSVAFALLSLQPPCEAREDSSNTKVDWWANSWIPQYKQIPILLASPLRRVREESMVHTLEDNI